MNVEDLAGVRREAVVAPAPRLPVEGARTVGDRAARSGGPVGA
ncbi:hypothetical protein [Geodermatophilus poikilotrophus]|nr:hypothetical protein [Geodermatophilus poikilotrophus]